MDGTGSGSYPVAVFDIGEVEASANRGLRYLIRFKIKMDHNEKCRGPEVDGTGSGLCPILGFSISDVEPPNSDNRIY
jgi:hypothetical protein